MEGVSIEHIIEDIAKVRARGQPNHARFLEEEKRKLSLSWNAINTWILETMRQRRGIHIPTLMKMTWEVVPPKRDPKRRDSSEGAAETGEESALLRLRPVFVLTDAFCRGLRLPNHKKTPLSANCAPCMDLNLSNLAIKYSRSLTKEIMFMSVRDIVRAISDHVSSNRRIAIQFAVGTLLSKERRVTFSFDRNAMKPSEDGTVASTHGLLQVAEEAPSAETEQPDTHPSDETHSHSPDAKADEQDRTSSMSERQSESARDREAGEPAVPRLWQANERPPLNPYLDPSLSEEDAHAALLATFGEQSAFQAGAEAGENAARRGGGALSGTMGGFGDDPLDFPLTSELSGTLLASQDEELDNPVMRDAYMRHLRSMERQAGDVERLEAAMQDRLANMERVDKGRKGKHREQLQELQCFIKDQIAAKRLEREQMEKERRSHSNVSEPSEILTRSGGVAASLTMGRLPTPSPASDSDMDDDGDDSHALPHAHASLASPGGSRSASSLLESLSGEGGEKVKDAVIRKMKTTVCPGATKGKSKKMNRKQLLAYLQRQMQEKEVRVRNQREQDLKEEKRFLTHVAAEMHLHSKYEKAMELAKQRDLLAAWERDGHIKNLGRLHNGGVAPMKEYSQRLTRHMDLTRSQDPLGKAHGGESAGPVANSARSSYGGLGVGFDPRMSARSSN